MACAIEITLTTELTPAFYALVDVAHEIEARQGEDAAIEWLERTIMADFGLFCRISTAPSRPQLKLITGGLRDAV